MPDNKPENLQEVLAKIRESLPTETQSAGVGQKEQSALMYQIAVDTANEQLQSLTQDRKERKTYADKSFKLVCTWITGVFFVLILQGFLSQTVEFSVDGSTFHLSFKLPDSVLLAIVGGTTVSVIGIFLVVANYLFPKR